MNGHRFLHHPQRHRQQYRDNCWNSNRNNDDANANVNVYDDVHDNADADGNESDFLWDDDIDKTPIPTSSSDGDNEEYLVNHQNRCLDRENLFEDNNYHYKDSKNSHDDFTHTSSSSFSFSNPATGSDDRSNVSNESSVVEKIESSVVDKIEDFILQTVIEPLSEEPNPSPPEIDVEVDAIGFKRKLSFHHLSQARSLTSIIMVASFCYDLLAPPTMDASDSSEEEGASEENSNSNSNSNSNTNSNRTNLHRHGRHRRIPSRKTTSTREVYYFYVTYFRDQRECDRAIWDLVRILDLPSRQSLGLVASPRGWFCGSIDVYNAHTNELKFNGRDLDAHGMAITPSTYDNPHHCNDRDGIDPAAGEREVDRPNTNDIRIESDARCILVIEKEGIYTRLSEDKFFLRYFPCILVTGKGFPDIATRRWVWRMQRTLKIPVYGLCDCNPYGVSVLDTYRHHQGVKLSVDRNNQSRKQRNRNRDGSADTEEDDSFKMHWIGLRPSQVETMGLPSEVFQELTNNDTKRLDSLMVPTKSSKSKPFAERGRNKAQRLHELRAMRKYKVELEALHWKGADYLSRFVYETIMKQQESHQEAPRGQKIITQCRPPQHQSGFDLSDRSDSDGSDDGIPETTKSQASY